MDRKEPTVQAPIPCRLQDPCRTMRLHLWLLVAAALAPLATSNHLDFNGTHFVEVDDKGEFVSIAEQTEGGYVVDLEEEEEEEDQDLDEEEDRRVKSYHIQTWKMHTYATFLDIAAQYYPKWCHGVNMIEFLW